MRFPELDEVSVRVYREAVRRGRFIPATIAERLGLDPPGIARAERILSALRLIRPMPGCPEVLVPVGPDTAAAGLVAPAENQIRDLQSAVTEVRTQIMALAPAYFEDRRDGNHNEAFDMITDASMVQPVLNEHARRCESEIMTIQPGGARPAHLLSATRGPLIEALERGVDNRTIYQHPARTDLVTRAYVSDVTKRGARVRTTQEVIDRMVIFDHEVAFVPERGVASRAAGAIVVREPALVGYLCDVFEHLWSTAVPFQPDADRAAPVDEDVKRAVIRLLAKGYKDETIARRLGTSVRTCRRHISELMDRLGTTSRFQAGVEATRLGLIDDVDGDDKPATADGGRGERHVLDV
ncbi:helix-turn-helix transcriptional regulator [Micromonospora tarensis]|uniref:Response regulator transcription factor n=1 Tax=Micromonospora tarensis TaxID=2806100 RepID=A0ABS1YD03_9ACTN|nr:LuxR C-terminal-related transcriptional regulator [Micromonospora tarensis]MBM0275235.1 response regulator transcription factor [Micromonospora tarensis]